MDDMNMSANEVEGIETGTELEEVNGNSNGGALFMGIVGGVLAYAIIGGVKKLRTIAEEKYIARKLAKANVEAVQEETTVFEETQDEESGEEDEE